MTEDSAQRPVAAAVGADHVDADHLRKRAGPWLFMWPSA